MRTILVFLVLITVGASTTACDLLAQTSSSTEQDGQITQQDGGQAGQGAAGQGPAGGRFPGASGLLAEVSGDTLQIQGADGQVAVTYSTDTTITETVDGSADDLAVGACVTVQTEDAGNGNSGSATASKVTASTVTVSQPASDDTCSTGRIGQGGGLPGGLPSGRPTDMPEPAELPDGNRPSGAPGQGFGGFPVAGQVTSVDADTFVVEATRPAGTSGEDDQPSDETTTSAVTVTTTADTTWRIEQSADADALVAGSCVTALGTADSSGAVEAASISVRPDEGDGCVGFGPRGQAPGVDSENGENNG